MRSVNGIKDLITGLNQATGAENAIINMFKSEDKWTKIILQCNTMRGLNNIFCDEILPNFIKRNFTEKLHLVSSFLHLNAEQAKIVKNIKENSHHFTLYQMAKALDYFDHQFNLIDPVFIFETKASFQHTTPNLLL